MPWGLRSGLPEQAFTVGRVTAGVQSSAAIPDEIDIYRGAHYSIGWYEKSGPIPVGTEADSPFE